MLEFTQMVVGSSFVAVVSVTSWFIGLLMGLAIMKIAFGAPGKHADVTDLLKRERQAAASRPAAVAQVAPGGPTQS